MSRPPHAREKVLDAFERLLIDEGARAATIDATARAAGVSKGGLLYHFGSREALEAGVVARLNDLVTADVAAMSAAPEGPVAYFLRTSAMDGDPLDRAIIAVSQIAQGGNALALDALHTMREQWAELLEPHTADATALALVLLVSDGLYFNNAIREGGIAGPVPRGEAMSALIALVETATRPAR
ncbi:MAG: helix-turn-helix domain-containing protein [Microbacterium sp.]|uniref:TetR/AcrR family transcriptional regulator n=1 Tax=Microbacterium sp. TaxID=51671 RepID=UPI0039E3C676